METIFSAIQMAIAHHQAGRLEEADQIYRQILAVEPDHADTLYLRGRLAHQVGRHAEAVDYLQRAIRSDPSEPTFYNNLGEALRALHRLPEAVVAYQHALRLKPDYALARNNLGTAYQAQGSLDEAEDTYRAALRDHPDFIECFNNLGTLLRAQGRLDEARDCFHAALQRYPDFVEALVNLANVHRDVGDLDRAIAGYERAMWLRPTDADVQFSLANAWFAQQRWADALAGFQAVLKLQPDHGLATLNQAVAAARLGRLDEARALALHAVELLPSHAQAHNNLAVYLHACGQVDEAVANCRRAVELNPSDATLHSNLLLAMLHHPDLDAATIFTEHRDWARRHADPLLPSGHAHLNAAVAHRRLRLGYVSPFFRQHAVTAFFEPILSAHDRKLFEVFCYSDTALTDATTERLRTQAQHWRDVRSLSDADLVERIRADQIDILVDLSGHLAGNRLLAFARKPAPIQVTYLGYQATTGMPAIDYRLTDAFADPANATEELHTEELVRLPHGFYCYRPPLDVPPSLPLPAEGNGYVTFGSFNKFEKVTAQVLTAWAKILASVPNSRLILLTEPSAMLRHRVSVVFAQAGVGDDRLSFVEPRLHREFLDLVQHADIALDPFPFQGHTTTCDALWMGVPTVSRIGHTYVSRFGATALMAVGLADLVATNVDQYVDSAVRLASDVDRLRQLRAGLRESMAASHLVDGEGFTRHLEAAYRHMWIRWCADAEKQ